MPSNISMTYKEELLLNLQDKEYRESFVASHINNGIAFQIRMLRGSLTQEEIGKRAGMKQEAICRLENPNYGSFTLKTLKQIAATFDVGLIVRFVPFSDLLKWDLNLSNETLKVQSFDKEPSLKEEKQEAQKEKFGILLRKTTDVQTKLPLLFLAHNASKASGQERSPQESVPTPLQERINIPFGQAG